MQLFHTLLYTNMQCESNGASFTPYNCDVNFTHVTCLFKTPCCMPKVTVANITIVNPTLHTFLIATTLKDGDVRLVNGNFISEGIVEIFYSGQWGTVCDDDWDIKDATVVCRQLNYFTATRAWPGAHFGLGTGPIYMDNVNCTGNETSLNQCEFRGWGLTKGSVFSQMKALNLHGLINVELLWDNLGLRYKTKSVID